MVMTKMERKEYDKLRYQRRKDNILLKDNQWLSDPKNKIKATEIIQREKQRLLLLENHKWQPPPKV